jgi:hypothetical protein
MTRLAYDQNVNEESRIRDKRLAIGQLKGKPEFAFRHKGSETQNLLGYKYALEYRDQNLTRKPNNLEASFLSADAADRPPRRGLRCKVQ